MSAQSGDSNGCGWIVALGIAAAAYFVFMKKDEPPAPVITVPEVSGSPAPMPDPDPSPTTAVQPEPIQPSHNYDFVEGAAYGYVAALSEEDRKKGVAVKQVVYYRYRGVIDGKYTLENVDADGTLQAVLTCARPCHAIRTWWSGQSQVVAYDNQSVMGAAMEDAISGKLRRYDPPAPPSSETIETEQSPENAV